MIALISGEVAMRRGDHVVVSANGVGYRLNVSAETLSHVPRIGETATLFSHLIVRDAGSSAYRDHWGAAHPSGANFVMADGSVRTIAYRPPPELVTALLTPRGGEPPGDF